VLPVITQQWTREEIGTVVKALRGGGGGGRFYSAITTPRMLIPFDLMLTRVHPRLLPADRLPITHASLSGCRLPQSMHRQRRSV